MALFGQTAKQWRGRNPRVKGNIRDYASVSQLLVLANIEALNAELIRMGYAQHDRLVLLNEAAIRQLKSLTENNLATKLLT